MQHSLAHLDAEIAKHKKLSAFHFPHIEAKLTATELQASRAALQSNSDKLANSVKLSLSEKREFLRRNQPLVTDLVSLRKKEKTFPQKSNPPPQKKRPVSAALGKLPSKKDRRNDEDQQAANAHVNDDASSCHPQPHLDSDRGGGYHHYDHST